MTFETVLPMSWQDKITSRLPPMLEMLVRRGLRLCLIRGKTCRGRGPGLHVAAQHLASYCNLFSVQLLGLCLCVS